MKYPQAIQKLVDIFSQLPTVGPKTAERYVFYLLKQPTEELQKLAQAITELKERTILCQDCLAISESNPCSICKDNRRNHSLLCLVADSRDMIALESIKQYNGLYFVLGGVINTIENIGPEKLRVNELLLRLKKNQIKEIILGLDPNLEGETTAIYLTKLLKPYKIKITHLAKGLPMGADLEYADEITLANALKYRSEI